MDILLLGSLMGFGFAFNEELARQTQILKAMQVYQAQRGTTQGQPVLKRSSHQQELVQKASEALESKDYELALSFSERLLKLEQFDPLYYVLRGDCLAWLGRISDAIENYDKCLDVNERTRSLSPYLENNLKISINQLEEIQSKIIHSDQKPTMEEICRMLDEVKAKQTQTISTVEPSISTVEPSVSNGMRRDVELAVNQLLQNKDPVDLFKHLDLSEPVSNCLDRLVLYQTGLETMLKLSNKNSFVTFVVDKCRLPNLFTQFACGKYKGKAYLVAEIGWLPENLYYIAEQRGFHLNPDPNYQYSTEEGGSMFQQELSELKPRHWTQIIEEMHILATNDELYSVRANTGVLK